MKKIVIDCLGGDLGAKPIVAGVVEAIHTFQFEPILVGDENEINALLPKTMQGKYKTIHTTDFIKMEESATDALKRRDSSIFKAMDLLRSKEADGLVSAGHSGATMSLATLRAGRIKGVSRPAIATLLPRIDDKRCLLLDAGANVDCKAEHFFQFAIMGKAYMQNVMHIKHPRIGLMSNGEEESKGNDQTKEAHTYLKDIEGFIGNIEGSNLFDGSLEVAVCDGFVGNIVLKTSEGAAEFFKNFFKKEIKESLTATLGALLMKTVFKNLKKRIDYAEYGGAPLLGVDGCVIISHGKSNSLAIKNAILQALKFSESGVNGYIARALDEACVK